jgi:hypothetical protein
VGGLQFGFQIGVPIAHCTDELKQLRIIRQSCGQFHLQRGLCEIVQAENG